MPDPVQRTQSREEKTTRKALERNKNFCVQYRTRNATGHVNTRLAKNALQEARQLFEALSTIVNKHLETLAKANPPTDEATMEGYDSTWDTEISNFQIWFDENSVEVEKLIDEETQNLLKLTNKAPRQDLITEYNAQKDILNEKIA